MNKKGFIGVIIGLLVIIVIILLFAILIHYSLKSVAITTITISDKERISDGDSSYYLIFTENEVFKNQDSMLHGKFDSSDVYSNLKIGQTYNVKVNWYRVPFWSMYRNILEIK